MFKNKDNRTKKEQLEKAELFDLMERLNGNVEEIWHKLDLVAHSLQEISESGFDQEVGDALISLARAHSKDYDKKIKKMEEAVAGKV